MLDEINYLFRLPDLVLRVFTMVLTCCNNYLSKGLLDSVDRALDPRSWGRRFNPVEEPNYVWMKNVIERLSHQ